MKHDHSAGWQLCPGIPPESGSCGLRCLLGCERCWTTHVRLHHPKRRRRRIKRQEVTA